MKARPAAEAEASASVQAMFRRIAPRYDQMNRLMTAGQDVRWRRMVVRLAQLPQGGSVLDLGAGTGDLAREVLRQSSKHGAEIRGTPLHRVIAADFTLAMMRLGQSRPEQAPQNLTWSCADALALPFADESFDRIVSGFLLRNVLDLPHALREQFRVLKPGGRMVTLDTTRPRPSLLSPLIRFHMHRVIPFLGDLLTGDRQAYTYLPDTSERFLLAEDLQARMAAAGFCQTGFRRLMFGTIAIHWGNKPE